MEVRGIVVLIDLRATHALEYLSSVTEPGSECFRKFLDFKEVRGRRRITTGVRSQKAVTKKEMSVKISELAEAKHLR